MWELVQDGMLVFIRNNLVGFGGERRAFEVQLGTLC